MRPWVSEIGEEVVYGPDMPGCCQRDAREAADSFECPACGAKWQAVLPAEPEECAFTERPEQERKGAA